LQTTGHVIGTITPARSMGIGAMHHEGLCFKTGAGAGEAVGALGPGGGVQSYHSPSHDSSFVPHPQLVPFSLHVCVLLTQVPSGS
jgi:hypothetical protein